MARKTTVAGIDHESWTVQVLPLPKGCTRGAAFGFCGGYPVGRVEAARKPSVGCWWPGGNAALIALDGQPLAAPGHASGDVMVGQWSREGAGGAVCWTLTGDSLTGTVIHPDGFTSSSASSASGGTIVGTGTPRVTKGAYARKVGLVWLPTGQSQVVRAEQDVTLTATDGTAVAGDIRGKATLWSVPEAVPVSLHPDGMFMSSVAAIDGATQVGNVWRGMCSRAALWSGSVTSFVDLTPKGFKTANASAASRGYQVGGARKKEHTKSGTPGSDNRAMLWQGAADRVVDLQALLEGTDYNASVALTIMLDGDTVRVCGEASRFEVTGAGTPGEGHVVPVAHPVLWTARLVK